MSESFLPESGSFVIYDFLKAPDVVDAARCFNQVFRREEPLSVALNLTEEEFEPIAQSITEKSASDSLGITARDRETGELLGFSMGKEYGKSDTFAKEPSLDNKFLPLFAIHEELDQQFCAKYSPGPRQYFLHHTLAVDQEKLRPGHENISEKLNLLTHRLAEVRGYKAILGHATSLFTQRLYRQSGFIEVGRILYKEFVYNDEHPFCNIKWHKCLIMFMKSI